jgi:hypothetical protein
MYISVVSTANEDKQARLWFVYRSAILFATRVGNCCIAALDHIIFVKPRIELSTSETRIELRKAETPPYLAVQYVYTVC